MGTSLSEKVPCYVDVAVRSPRDETGSPTSTEKHFSPVHHRVVGSDEGEKEKGKG